jgi:hypothetical protein
VNSSVGVDVTIGDGMQCRVSPQTGVNHRSGPYLRAQSAGVRRCRRGHSSRTMGRTGPQVTARAILCRQHGQQMGKHRGDDVADVSP